MGGNYWVSDEEEGDNFDFERKIVDAIGKKKIACIFDFVKLISGALESNGDNDKLWKQCHK